MQGGVGCCHFLAFAARRVLPALNHTTVKVVPTLNWTAKFPNGKFNLEL